MPKISWKGIGRVALSVGEQLFPAIKIVEALATKKPLSAQEKQDLAFQALHDELVSQLLPKQLEDPRLETAIRKLVDDGVALNNVIATLRNETKTPSPTPE